MAGFSLALTSHHWQKLEKKKKKSKTSIHRRFICNLFPRARIMQAFGVETCAWAMPLPRTSAGLLWPPHLTGQQQSCSLIGSPGQSTCSSSTLLWSPATVTSPRQRGPHTPLNPTVPHNHSSTWGSLKPHKGLSSQGEPAPFVKV